METASALIHVEEKTLTFAKYFGEQVKATNKERKRERERD